jgi:4-amino-4-deoxy-L-arabinose transferase-like glycosyltransferase
LFLAVSLPWYVLLQMKEPQFLHVFIGEHNLARFGTNRYFHRQPVFYYLPVMVVSLIPWTALAVPALGRAIRAARDRMASTAAFEQLLLIWALFPVLFFTLSSSKLPGYTLPALPAFAILIGIYLAEWEQGKVKLSQAALAWHSCLVGLLLAGTIAVVRFRENWAMPPLDVILWLTLLLLVLSVTLFLLLRRLSPWGFATFTVCAVAASIVLALQLYGPVADRKESMRGLAAIIGNYAERNEPIYVYSTPRSVEFGLEFYREAPVPVYGIEAAPPADTHIVVVEEGADEEFRNMVPGRIVTFLTTDKAYEVNIYQVGER